MARRPSPPKSGKAPTKKLGHTATPAKAAGTPLGAGMGPRSARPWLAWALFAALLLVCALWFAQKVVLHTADLGRHLRNGEVVLATGQVPATNLYSYTHPNHPTVCHHWGTGVLFALLHRWGGLPALSLLNVLLGVLAFALALHAARRLAGWPVALALGTLLLPLFGFRNEIRPEGFSYALFAAFLWLLVRQQQAWPGHGPASPGMAATRTPLLRQVPGRLAAVLLPLQLLWVNLHLFFILGPLSVAAFAFMALLHRQPGHARGLGLLAGLLLLVCLLNPFGVQGLLQPLTILNEYGYEIYENKSLPFLHNRQLELQAMGQPASSLRYLHAEALMALQLLLVGLALRRQPRRLLAWAALLLAFVGLALLALRGLPLWVLAALPATAALLAGFRLPQRQQRPAQRLALALVAVGVVGVLAWPNTYASPRRFVQLPTGQRYSLNGLGALAYPDAPDLPHKLGRFLRSHAVNGPLFNNYDIGGYLIWELYPNWRVFVDNRPEAYPVRFFKEVYIPMQEDEAVWARQDSLHRFNAIVFMRHDQTPWGQSFLIRRARDPRWACVYIDELSIVWVRRNEANRRIIEAWEPLFGPMIRSN